MFDPMSVDGPDANPVPSPFPFEDPPPPLFDGDACYPGVAKAFVGWINEADLGVARAPEWTPYVPSVYAMITRDIVPIFNPGAGMDASGWFDSNRYPVHKVRWWGQGVCWAPQNPTAPDFPAEINYSATVESTFLEIDDGRRLDTEVFQW
jgi:hypothetical protein